MHSPLPDASALEAGILEDSEPSRGSRVQDNVRNLLRASVLSSIRGSTFAPFRSSTATPAPNQATVEDEPRSPLQSPLRQQQRVQIAPLPSPSSQTTTASTTSTSSTEDGAAVPGMLFPPVTYQHQVQEMAHQSAMFNTRAIAALHHPDLSDPSLAVFLQQKTEDRQRRAWKRSKNRKLRHATAKRGKSAWVLCLVAAALLMGIVATYLALATSGEVSTTFHVLFILGILLATIVFAHTLVRICFFRPSIPESPRIYVVSGGQHRRRHRHHRHRSHSRQHGQHHHLEMPTLTEDLEEYSAEFIPPMPIQVHTPVDEVRPDSREAEVSTSAERASRAWDKEVEAVPNPPPAYGRWRGSVRANPDLLHWQPIPSPVDPTTPALPSPTYEETMNAAQREGENTSGPPSYVTRDSPARRRDVQEARPGLAQAQSAEQGAVVPDPEMLEARQRAEAVVGLGYSPVARAW